MKIQFKLYILFVLTLLGTNLAIAANIYCQTNLHNNDLFTKFIFNGITYAPDKQTKQTTVYANMDGDKKGEVIVAIQMLPIQGDGWYQTFAFVYRTDGKGNQKVLLKTIHLGELLGAEVGDHTQEKVIDVVDLKDDGRKAVALWSTSGMHHHNLIIIGMRGSKVVTLFKGGSDNQLKYEPSKNKYIITEGDTECLGCSGDNKEKWRENVWEWNGKKFVYSKKKSSVHDVSERSGSVAYRKITVK